MNNLAPMKNCPVGVHGKLNIVADILFNALPIVCGSSLFVFVLLLSVYIDLRPMNI